MSFTIATKIFISFIVVNIILFFSENTKAQTIERKSTSFKDCDRSNIIIANNPSEETPSIPEDSGSPSIRRSPIPGQPEFEPEKIPLKIPTRNNYRISPGITIVNPSGYGAAWGSVGIGIGLQERVRFIDRADGVIGLGFGLGNPQKNVGLQVGVSLVDVSDPLSDGAINVKIHRQLPNNFSIALGTQGLFTWGNTDGGSSVYGSVSKRFILKEDFTKPFSEVYTTIGVGGGQFRSESDIENDIESIGIFSSMSIRVIQPVSIITEWTGQDLTIGGSIVPFRNLPLVIVPAVTDISGSAGDGARFILGLGYSFRF